MCTNLLLVALICAINVSYGADVARCSNRTESTTTFGPYDDGVAARYLFERCLEMEPDATAWRVQVSFFNTDARCKKAPFMNIHAPGKIHSIYNEDIVRDGNCSHVCVNKTFDLIFSACYTIETTFYVDGHARNINYSYFNIKNDYTKDNITTNQALVDILNQDDENATIVLHTGVPFDDFELTICDQLNYTREAACVAVERAACRSGAAELQCRARLARGRCYELHLRLHAPWASGLFNEQALVFYESCAQRKAPPLVSGRSWAWAWALGALGALGAALCAARAACRSRDARALHKAVLKEWLVHRVESTPVPAVERPARRTVLLLYAREGAACARLCAALADLLRHEPNTQVYDLFSPEVLSLAAAAPGAWVRSLLAQPDVAVVLLQTPALAALYADQVAASEPHSLAGPLLGRRVLYRAPQYGDSLLQYALRLASEAHRNDYTKYYLATLSAMPTDVFPSLVPYRRYELPHAASLLARDVCGTHDTRDTHDTRGTQHLHALEDAARELADLARDQPDYLMEHLMFV